MTDKDAQDKKQVIELEEGEEPPERSSQRTSQSPQETGDSPGQGTASRDWQESLSQFVRQNPQALWGAGLGSGAGLLKALLTGEGYLSSPLLGGLLGGGLGYGSQEILADLAQETSGTRKGEQDELTWGEIAHLPIDVGTAIGEPVAGEVDRARQEAAERRRERRKAKIERRVNRKRVEEGKEPIEGTHPPNKPLPETGLSHFFGVGLSPLGKAVLGREHEEPVLGRGESFWDSYGIGLSEMGEDIFGGGE